MYDLMMWERVRIGEVAVLCCGLLLLANVFVIGQTGDFTLWVATKALFAVGLLFLLFDR